MAQGELQNIGALEYQLRALPFWTDGLEDQVSETAISQDLVYIPVYQYTARVISRMVVIRAASPASIDRFVVPTAREDESGGVRQVVYLASLPSSMLALPLLCRLDE